MRVPARSEEFIFSLRGTALLEAEREDPGGLTETFRRLAHWIEGYLDDNQPLIDTRFARYRWATTLVVAQVVLWVAEILMAEKPVPPPPPNLGIPETRGGGSGGEKR